MYDFMNYNFFKGIKGGGATTQNTLCMSLCINALTSSQIRQNA